MTLVCHHPDLASNPGRYFTSSPAWREDGVGITPSTGIYLQDDTSEDLTHTTLNINITVDHFRNMSFNYSCLLVLAENGLPATGEVETSDEVTVDPVGELVLHTNVYICTYVQLLPRMPVISFYHTWIHLQYLILEAVFILFTDTHARMWVTGP